MFILNNELNLNYEKFENFAYYFSIQYVYPSIRGISFNFVTAVAIFTP